MVSFNTGGTSFESGHWTCIQETKRPRMAQFCKFHECIILLFVTLILASKLPDQIIFYFRLNFILIPNWDIVGVFQYHEKCFFSSAKVFFQKLPNSFLLHFSEEYKPFQKLNFFNKLLVGECHACITVKIAHSSVDPTAPAILQPGSNPHLCIFSIFNWIVTRKGLK